jgi:hypothetical protein
MGGVMTPFWNLLHRRVSGCLLAVFVLITVFLPVAPVLADGGIAMSGSFYQQAFEIPQGSSISGPDVYVVVFNNSSNQLKVKMISQAPPGVRLVLSQTEFTLAASGQQQVLVGVEVGTDAVPGKYEISISAEPYKETVSGIQLAGAASQKASLVVLGESGTVSVQATSPDQQPIAATVRLYRAVAGQDREVAYSEKGNLDAKVAPGSFAAASFLGGMKLAEERFDVAAGESKKLTLSGATVYFEGFDIVPNDEKKSGKLAFVQIVYTLKNLYQRVVKGEVILDVSRDEAPLEELSLATLSPLEMGRVGLNYNYIPAGGWLDGSYSFKLQMKLDDKPYAASLVEQLKVGGVNAAGATTPAVTGGKGGAMTPAVIGGLAAGVVVAVGIGFWLYRKRRKV